MTWDVDGRSWVVKSIWDENLGLVHNVTFQTYFEERNNGR